MSRSKARTHSQPDDHTCGPAALKTALEILGMRSSLRKLTDLCKTNRNGTSVKNLIRAINQLGFQVLATEWATLKHLQSALKFTPDQPRAAIVNYQEIELEDEEDESGHYATVAGFSARNSRIVLFNPSTGKKKSYKWTKFIDLWYDYDYKRIRRHSRDQQFKLTRRYYNRLLLVVARSPQSLPKFSISTSKLFLTK